MHPSPFLQNLVRIASVAGDEIMAVYATGFTATAKADNSPVTLADEAAEAVILRELAKADPRTPVISEEAAAKGIVPAVAGRFYLVDPLDGTKEFVSRNGEFTVNIALVENGAPVAGVVYAPAIGRLFVGEVGLGAMEQQDSGPWRHIAVRAASAEGPDVVASRSHRDQATDAFIAAVGATHIRSAGSSLKFCLVAAGEADLYPRYGRTMEWDTAAGHAVLRSAGGQVVTADGLPLTYGKRGSENPAFVALGAPSLPTVKHFAGNAR